MTRKQPDKPSPLQKLRCAVYTRKSTDEGLEMEFNSLDAQREAAEAFIVSQKHEGWQLVPERFDDGGYTGGNMDRPALKRLLAAVEARTVDCARASSTLETGANFACRTVAASSPEKRWHSALSCTSACASTCH